MRNIILFITAVFILVSCQNENNNLNITGSVTGISSGKIYLQKYDNKMFFVIDSADIQEGEFKFSKNVVVPEIYGLTLDTLKQTYLLFVDENPVSVQLDSTRYYRNTVVTGSEIQDLYLDFMKNQRNIEISDFIKSNPASLVSAYAFYRYYSYQLTPSEIEANLKLLDPSLSGTPYVKLLEKLPKTLETVEIGAKALDFTAANTSGEELRFSDHLGDGYVLLDFWAAWCGPCRRENPNIVRVYNKYKDKGFDIFAVSLDEDADRWKEAIEKDDLDWTNVSDLKFWNSEPAALYGVRAIPFNILFDKEGTIIAKNLKGDDLDRKLGELLN